MRWDIEGSAFRGDAVFFAPTAELACTYAEHVYMNGDVDYGYEGQNDEAANETAFLGASPVVYKVRLTLENPAILDAELVSEIARELGVPTAKIGRFVEDFNDSVPTEREAVLAWVRKHGHDGAILPQDQMPVYAGGDWDWFTSYVSFNPATQVKFILAEPAVALKESNDRRPRMRA